MRDVKFPSVWNECLNDIRVENLAQKLYIERLEGMLNELGRVNEDRLATFIREMQHNSNFRGQKIQQVKQVRAVFGMNLKDAKDAVDRYYETPHSDLDANAGER